MMKNLFYLLLIVFFQTAFAQDGLLNEICDSNRVSGKVIYDWKNQKDKGICAKAECTHSDRRTERVKCLKQSTFPNTIEVHLDDTISSHKSFRIHGRYEDATLYPGISCYEVCRPKERSGFLGRVVVESGLEREECTQCMKGWKSKDGLDSYLYPEIGKTLYEGAKCYHLCKLPKGEFTEARNFSEDCQKCAGMNSFTAEKFIYILTRAETCFELDSTKGRRQLKTKVCQDIQRPILTKYISEETMASRFLKFAKDCFEVDEKTEGDLYRQSVRDSLCSEEAIDNSDRNTPGKDKLPDNTLPAVRKSGAQKQ